MHTISSKDESWFPVFDWRGEPTFHKHLKRTFPSALHTWEGPCVFCLKWNVPREALTQKKARFPCSGLYSGSCFISQDAVWLNNCMSPSCPHDTGQFSLLPLGNSRDSLRRLSQVYRNINFSTAAWRKFHAPHIMSRWELIPCLWLKRWASFPQAPQVEFSLSNR